MEDDFLWVELIKWLINNGARKFVVFLEKSTSRSQTSTYVNQLLASQENVEVLTTSASTLDHKQKTGLYLEKTKRLGPLKAVFFMAMVTTLFQFFFRLQWFHMFIRNILNFQKDMINRKVSNLNSVAPPNVCFIGLSSGGLIELEKRHSKGSPTILIHSDNTANSLSALPYLKRLLSLPEEAGGRDAGLLCNITVSSTLGYNNGKMAGFRSPSD